MRSRPFVLLFALLALVPGSARAQDFGVMESGETIDRGNFKLRVNPLVIFGKNGGDKTVGVAVVDGFTDKFDLEGGLAFYDGVTFFGANAELFGALDFAFESISDNRGSFKTVHVVPGIEYKLGEDLDFVAELGLAVNNDARHYFSAPRVLLPLIAAA